MRNCTVYDTVGGKGVVDSAFSKHRCRFLSKSGKQKIGKTAIERTTRRQATSCQQSAEWGMRAVVQGSFPWLKNRLLCTDSVEDHQVLLHTIPMLLNFRTHHIGLNQLSSTYYPMFNAAGDDVLDILN
jgi:hypothetical protein